MNPFAFLASANEAVDGPATRWDGPGIIILKLLAVVFLVLLNGFFVSVTGRRTWPWGLMNLAATWAL